MRSGGIGSSRWLLFGHGCGTTADGNMQRATLRIEAEELSMLARVHAVLSGNRSVEPLTWRERGLLFDRMAAACEAVAAMTPAERQACSLAFHQRFGPAGDLAPGTVGCRTRRPDMTAIADRLDLRLSVEDKNRLRRAAELHGLPVATFVREAALREADTTIAHPPKARRGGLASRMRGRATARMGTDEIMQLTRGA